MPARDHTRYLICYDVSDDRRRARVAKCLQDFGCRVQLSVFEAVLGKDQAARMVEALSDRISKSDDRVRIYPLHPSALERRRQLGKAYSPVQTMFDEGMIV